MSIYKGDNIKVEIFGQSHSQEIGVKCKGFPKVEIDMQKFCKVMQRRKPSNAKFSTLRKETDQVEFTSGLVNNVIEGDFQAQIKNIDKKSQDYKDLYGKPRPSHADYCSYLKDGNLDFSGGGRFSGRMTAPLCIAGAIADQYLQDKGIRIYAYLQKVGSIEGQSYKQDINEKKLQQIKFGEDNSFPSLSNKEQMLNEIEKAQKQGDSVGAICECVVLGFPQGIGDCLFEGIEGKIANIIYSIPAVKGVEFGLGFEFANKLGSDANDQLFYEGDKIKTSTNNNGGINGGISNGMPIVFRVAFKPTPSIFKKQKTVDLINKVNTEIIINGRHDSCVAVRAVPVVECATAIALLDLILSKESN